MEQTSGTNPTDASAERGPGDGQTAETPPPEQPGFRSRGRARRRARFLRRARELAYRDLGGLVYNLHRFGQRNDPLVLAKLNTLSLIDVELRTIETALAERRPITVLREAGITACPRCAAIHGSEDRFCPNCGLPMSRHADLPIAGAPAGSPPAPDRPGAGSPSPAQPSGAPQSAPAQPAAPAPVRASPAAAAPGAPATAGAPVTERHTPAPPAKSAPATGSGRSPAPPARAGAQSDPASGVGSGPGAEEPTEIIRPQAPGS